MADYQGENLGYFCTKCCELVIVSSLKEFQKHLLKKHRNEKHFRCGQNGCDRVFVSRDSLSRHIRDSHSDLVTEPIQAIINEPPAAAAVCSEEIRLSPRSSCFDFDWNDSGNDSSQNCSDRDSDDGDFVGEEEETYYSDDIEDFLEYHAGLMILNLRSHGNLTGTSIFSMQVEVTKLLHTYISWLRKKVKVALEREGLPVDRIISILRNFEAVDPFKKLKTKEKQIEYFKENFGFVEPEEKFLGVRFEQRLNPETNQFEPSQVNETFEYVPIIQTLGAVLRNPILKSLIEEEKKSEDGILRSYLDGERVQKNELINNYPHTLRINLYCDDVQGAPNALSSKTYRQNLTAFYFSIQNLPPEVNAHLNSIFLLLVAYRQDVNKYGLAKLLVPFFRDLKLLESDEGVKIVVSGVEYILRATLVCFCGDDLAAKEILGLMSPSAKIFCRKCLVSRPDFIYNGLAMGEMRTKELHAQYLQGTAAQKKSIGIIEECFLNKARFFDETLDAVFDTSHDLNNGLIKMECKLVLHNLIIVRKLFTVQQLNSLITDFNFGLPDRKNVPSANFAEENLSLQSYNLKQTAAQMACLLRAFPFLVSQFITDPNDPYIRLLILLQKIVSIVNTPEITAQHIYSLENLIVEHHNLFRQLFISEEDVEGEAAENEDVEDDPFAVDEVANNAAPRVAIEPEEQRGRMGRRRKIRFVNKHHSVRHYQEILKLFGPIILYICMRFEGKHAIIKRFAAICCNFTNLPKTMADLYQTIQACGLFNLRKSPKDVILYRNGQEVTLQSTEYVDSFLQFTNLQRYDVVTDTKCAVFCGVEFRPNLFVLLQSQADLGLPRFGCIKKIFIKNNIIYLVTEVWTTENFDESYTAYRINVNEEHATIEIINAAVLKYHLPISPWIPTGSDELYLSLRSTL